MILLSLLVHTATGTPAPSFNEDSVTPGWIGFVVTFLVAIAVVFLCVDLVRRIRRVRYRGEIRERLEAERAEEDAARKD
jgi:cytosine/uracil/thiamine/allantoin permease